MSREAMKLALDALEDLIPLCDPGFSVCYDVNKAITALREALAEQPAQQEPVAWMTKTGSVWKTKADETDEPLYTHPPAQRTWVGLSDEEIENLWHEFHDREFGWARRFTRAIEAKLKEKNT